jgi:hypothetical protein
VIAPPVFGKRRHYKLQKHFTYRRLFSYYEAIRFIIT